LTRSRQLAKMLVPAKMSFTTGILGDPLQAPNRFVTMNSQWTRFFTPFAAAVAVLSFVEQGIALEISGHRGASHDAPENTLAAVNLAWKRGADSVEIDIYLSKDGHIVAIHDATTKRYGGPDRKVADQTLAELKSLDVGRWKDQKFTGERIPTLLEVLATIPPGKRLFIEIKAGAEIIPELKRVLKQSGRKPAEAALIGFSYKTMTAAKRVLPQHTAYWIVSVKRNKQTGVWSPAIDEMIEKTKAAKLDGLDLGNAPAVIDREYVQRVKRAGLGLYVWTVNDKNEARRLRDAGVDGITTDRPGWLRKSLAEEQFQIDVEQSASICQHDPGSHPANVPFLAKETASAGAIP